MSYWSISNLLLLKYISEINIVLLLYETFYYYKILQPLQPYIEFPTFSPVHYNRNQSDNVCVDAVCAYTNACAFVGYICYSAINLPVMT